MVVSLPLSKSSRSCNFSNFSVQFSWFPPGFLTCRSRFFEALTRKIPKVCSPCCSKCRMHSLRILGTNPESSSLIVPGISAFEEQERASSSPGTEPKILSRPMRLSHEPICKQKMEKLETPTQDRVYIDDVQTDSKCEIWHSQGKNIVKVLTSVIIVMSFVFLDTL